MSRSQHIMGNLRLACLSSSGPSLYPSTWSEDVLVHSLLDFLLTDLAGL